MCSECTKESGAHTMGSRGTHWGVKEGTSDKCGRGPLMIVRRAH